MWINKVREIGFSVCIPCFNSVDRIEATLAHLQRQEVPEGLLWEVIVVDNASTDDTEDVARGIWREDKAADLRVVHESKAGLANARLCAFEASQYEFVAFVDDDNWLSETWVAQIFEFMSGHPYVGACGTKAVAHFGAPKPSWFDDYAVLFAVSPPDWKSEDVTEARGYLWGAGLTVRYSAWSELKAKGFQFLCTGRIGLSLVGGEEVELCMALKDAGWRLYYNAEVSLVHYMPAARLQEAYLLRLIQGINRSNVLLEHRRGWYGPEGIATGIRSGRLWQTGAAIKAFFIATLKRWLGKQSVGTRASQFGALGRLAGFIEIKNH